MIDREKERLLEEYSKTTIGEKYNKRYNLTLGILCVVAGLGCILLLVEELTSLDAATAKLLEMLLVAASIIAVALVGASFGYLNGGFEEYKKNLKKEVKATVKPVESKKVESVKKPAPVKKTSQVKKAEPIKKATPAKKPVATKKVAPAKKAAPAKKTVAKKSTTAKKTTTKTK